MDERSVAIRIFILRTKVFYHLLRPLIDMCASVGIAVDSKRSYIRVVETTTTA